MSESANLKRRRATLRRIHSCALRLTQKHGLDGFTLEDLAAEVGVSRRTLFNYYPSKIDAILGPRPDYPDELVAAFVAKQPTGELLADLVELTARIMENQQIDQISRADAIRLHVVLDSEPKLLAMSYRRFESTIDDFRDSMKAREGSHYEPLRAEVALRIACSLVDVALRRFAHDDDVHPTLADAFRATAAAGETLRSTSS